GFWFEDGAACCPVVCPGAVCPVALLFVGSKVRSRISKLRITIAASTSKIFSGSMLRCAFLLPLDNVCVVAAINKNSYSLNLYKIIVIVKKADYGNLPHLA